MDAVIETMTVTAGELMEGDVIVLPRVSVMKITCPAPGHVTVTTEKGYPVGYRSTDLVTIIRGI